MTTWITPDKLSKEELEWLVETLKVTNIRQEGAVIEEYRDSSGRIYPICVSLGLLYVETSSEHQDTLLHLKFGNRFSSIEDRNKFNVNLH